MIKNIENINELNEVLTNNKNVFVKIFTTWCGPCKMLKPEIEKITDEFKDVIFVEVDSDKIKEVGTKYKIYSVPTAIYFSNNNEVERFVGFRTSENIADFINECNQR